MKKIIFGLACSAALALSSCNSLEVAPPNSIVDEQIEEILNGTDQKKIDVILKALGDNLYTNFSLTGKSYLGYGDMNQTTQVDQEYIRNLMGNDVVNGRKAYNGDWHGPFYDLNATFRSNVSTWPMWAMPSDIVTAANKTLLYLTDERAEKNEMVAKYQGSAKCVRAYGYMQLMERFQPAYTNGGSTGMGMPIYTTYGVNEPAEISSATETYKFILDDLKDAVKKLQNVGYTKDNTEDIDLGVANYLLARAALWAGEWSTCIAAAKDIVDNYPEFIAEENFGAKDADLDALVDGSKEAKADDNAFYNIAKNPECIMGFHSGATGNCNYIYSYANVFAPGQGGKSQMWQCIDNRLYEKMDDNDFRKDNFTTKESAPYLYHYTATNTISQPIGDLANLKFAATICKGASARDYQQTCDNVMMRSSEVLLMLAEAYAQSNQDALAIQTLDKLLTARTKAGCTPLTCATYKGMAGLSTMQKVQLQWRLEMWCEKGLEFYNNKRWNIPVDRTSSTNHFSTVKTLSVADMTIEVPINETSTNHNWGF